MNDCEQLAEVWKFVAVVEAILLFVNVIWSSSTPRRRRSWPLPPPPPRPPGKP